MSVEKLVAALEKEAALREEALMEQAQAQAQAHLEMAERRAAQMDHFIAELKLDHAQQRQRANAAMAKIQAREARLRAGWQTVRLAFKLTENMYADFMAGPEYAPFIATQLAGAMALAGQVEKIIADPVTAKALGAQVEVDKAAPMGFTLISGGGKIRTGFNFHEALAEVWKAQAAEYYTLLFEEEADAG